MRTARVRARSEFAALAQRGERSRRRAVRVTYLAAETERAVREVRPAPGTVSPASGTVRVAFAIPRAVGSAVVRNRIRRRLRAALGELDAPAGTYLVSATPAAAALDYRALRHELDGCLQDLAARR